MKFCEYVLSAINDSPIYCFKPATRRFDIKNDGVYAPVCEEHFRYLQRLHK